MRANGVGFEACESVFLSTSIGFVLVSGQTGEEPEQAPLLDYNHTHTYTTRGLDIKTTRGSYTKKAKEDKTTTHVCFCSTEVFCSSEVGFVRRKCFRGFVGSFSRLVKYFRSFYPYPYWIQEFLVKGLIRAGLSHVGLIRRIFGPESGSRGTDSRETDCESNNFWSRQSTTYFEATYC